MRRTLERWTAHHNGIRVYGIDERKYEEELEAAYLARAAEDAQIESVEEASSDFSPNLVVAEAVLHPGSPGVGVPRCCRAHIARASSANAAVSRSPGATSISSS
jgi:hypothetical protein